MTERPEITWSIMHPVKPEVAYMREVIAQAAPYHVDSFEICGEVHSSLGGLDGAIFLRDYPVAAAALNRVQIDQNIAVLREIVGLAHASHRPVYYWHREVMVPRAVVENIPGLLDENGEFDLLGAAYQQLVRAKIREFFELVPEMDGLVLTLTESDYSVIHNSDPDRYPPAEVVKRVVETFAAELPGRGKRFVLRSFGSIAQDYEDILAGAARVSGKYPFEIETKITPYDFSPFLRFNPYLRKTGHSTLSAEYDSIGEFHGAGYLPAPDPARVLDAVAYARAQGVTRHVTRIDRIGHPTFASTQAINLLAFERAICGTGTTADDLWAEWAATHWPDGAPAMAALMQRDERAILSQQDRGHHLRHQHGRVDPRAAVCLRQPGDEPRRRERSRADVLQEQPRRGAVGQAAFYQQYALRTRVQRLWRVWQAGRPRPARIHAEQHLRGQQCAAAGRVGAPGEFRSRPVLERAQPCGGARLPRCVARRRPGGQRPRRRSATGRTGARRLQSAGR
jgi:hypothetical protein